MTETNPFPYFLPAQARILIMGSFPCYNGSGYGDWFYSGSGRNHLWTLLSEILQMPASTHDEKKALCEKHGIALTDIAYRIKRIKNNCSDANLRIIEFNKKGMDICLASGISRIFFTGKFVEKHFLKLYPGNTRPCFLLPSPSPAANRHIGGLEEYRKMVKSGKVKNVYDYRLMKYRQLLLAG